MPTTNNPQSPTDAPLVSPTGTVSTFGEPNNGPSNGKVQMKKQLGLTEGVAIILGIIFGSGKHYCFSYSRKNIMNRLLM